MRIETGKVYRTRAGGRVRIYAVGCAPEGTMPGSVHGAYENSVGEWKAGAWLSDGVFHLGQETVLDIVGEYTEPAPKFRAWLTPSLTEATGRRVVLIPDGDRPGGRVGIRAERAPWLDEPEAPHA